jgi:hypothetical protein
VPSIMNKNRNYPAAPHLLCQRPAHVQTSTHRRPLSRICGAAGQLRYWVAAPFFGKSWVVTKNLNYNHSRYCPSSSKLESL